MYIGALNVKQNSTSLSSFGMRSIFEYSKFDHWTFTHYHWANRRCYHMYLLVLSLDQKVKNDRNNF